MTQPPRLLVSVRSVDEARDAIAGGCDILDVKEPANGPLGMAASSTIAEIAASVRLTAPNVPVSAALGELAEWEARGAFPLLPPTMNFAKLGLARMRTRAGWQDLWRSVRRRIDDSSESCFSWVAVAYADDALALAPPPLEVVAAAAQTECHFVLIDTFTKDGRSLLDFQSPSSLRAISAATRGAGLQLALAGNLRAALLMQLGDRAPDLLAIRSAACPGGARNASVSASAVAQFRRAVRAVWPNPTDAVVA